MIPEDASQKTPELEKLDQKTSELEKFDQKTSDRDRSSQQEPGTELISLGRVNGVFGVKGWLKIHSDTSPRENIVAYKNWCLSGSIAGNGSEIHWVELETGRTQGKNIVAKLKGVDDRDAAQLLVGRTIAIERSELPRLDNNEFYWADLIGLDVIDSQAQPLGKVSRLFETGANDVMVVNESAGSGGEILIPWIIGSVITNVDLVTKCISVDWDPDY